MLVALYCSDYINFFPCWGNSDAGIVKIRDGKIKSNLKVWNCMNNERENQMKKFEILRIREVSKRQLFLVTPLPQIAIIIL